MTDQPFNNDRIDDVVLALLWANSFKEKVGGYRAWKSLPWDALDRLHIEGLISNPRGRAYSVTLDDEALERGRAVFTQWFATVSSASTATIYQFKITLDDSKPVIWRRIQLPSDATFWDLHCAVNDAMGWEDEHLHAFQLGDPPHAVDVGIPDADATSPNGVTTRAGWEVPIADHFKQASDRCVYLYDFGDDWSHEVVLEKIQPREAKTKYPRCLAGARACPPEDCGGVYGYQRICAALAVISQ